ncbi:hypothetical protein A11A3_02372 [Alcanivorax hongdengensis A-11-3]|uniref:HTH cro/C1-type domain-containing protein n=1 Tax=Alcanivorax hongdengensis A-11-3 TaxID=1177179 RepID=L0WHP7_9GAMM|nr:RodZ family helix-turn-helix domain-containing protein [Alcanivorax hongdengensis]EKF75677.1 hypothetical protein A11A3_02372 [Alcanivorax hongdengensis A-11-3]
MTENRLVLPGERCRQAREEQGMSTAQAAERLHLSHTYLLALEADDYERLPEATFVKGYLRNYARVLGLPADEIANTFQQMVNEDAFDKPLNLPELAPPAPAWRRPAIIVAILIIIALLVWALWPTSETLPPLAPSADTAPAQTQAPADAAQPGDDAQADAMSMDDSAPTGEDNGDMGIGDTADTGIADAPTAMDDSASTDEPVADDSNAVAEAEPVTAPAPGMDRLSLHFSGDCWVSVIDARGRTLHQGKQTDGSHLDLDGKPPFKLTLGDAGAVSAITLNGEAVTLPTNAPGSVVRISLP